jgi:hypothetical protein
MNAGNEVGPFYPSGIWEGFWEQKHYGRQPMQEFYLDFSPDGSIQGHGIDVVGRFVISGNYDRRSGNINWIKQYLGKHQVYYQGQPDGEGSILGFWSVASEFGGTLYLDRGAFAIRPRLAKPGGEEPIQELPL